MASESSAPDVRWRQRFQHFERAYALLASALMERDVADYPLEQEGIIQRFEYTFELGWKTFKDYLDHIGIVMTEASPRKVIKECAVSGVFDEADMDGKIYLDMMLKRNLLSHTYDFEHFSEILKHIQGEYLPQLGKQLRYLRDVELDGNA